MKPIDTAARDIWLAQADALFSSVAELTRGSVGISRASYGERESATLALLRDWGAQRHLKMSSDIAGNGLFALPDLSQAASIICGSHIDSVPQGGNFDGLAGVIAGLLVLDRFRSENLSVPLLVVAMRGEESAWFGKAYIGSSAALGKLKPADLELKNKHTGVPLQTAMAGANADIDVITRGEPAAWTAAAKAYIELHIEQGPLMVSRDWPTAIVSGLRGNIRHNRVVCVGEAGHSGAIPRWLRKDAVFAVSDLLMRLDRHWQRLLERGMDLVVTSGIMGTHADEHAVSRIPGTVEFSFEARSQDQETLNDFYESMRNECLAVSAARGVAFEFDRKIASPPALMDAALVQRLLDASKQAGMPVQTIPSGAGHDAAMFANAGIPSGMIFIRNENGSHNPAEAMDLADFIEGVEILYRTIKEMFLDGNYLRRNT